MIYMSILHGFSSAIFDYRTDLSNLDLLLYLYDIRELSGTSTTQVVSSWAQSCFSLQSLWQSEWQNTTGQRQIPAQICGFAYVSMSTYFFWIDITEHMTN